MKYFASLIFSAKLSWVIWFSFYLLKWLLLQAKYNFNWAPAISEFSKWIHFFFRKFRSINLFCIIHLVYLIPSQNLGWIKSIIWEKYFKRKTKWPQIERTFEHTHELQTIQHGLEKYTSKHTHNSVCIVSQQAYAHFNNVATAAAAPVTY